MLTHRRAKLNDLRAIIELYMDDELGKAREKDPTILDQRYIDAFHKIDADPNQYLMLVEDQEIVGTCHLTIMPGLTMIGTTRMNIESVRVSAKHRGNKIGSWMINAAIEYGKSHGATIFQLTTGKTRHRAHKFYESLGFIATHEGMKLKI
jgi:GNAT superfamily N-acetyltransferase